MFKHCESFGYKFVSVIISICKHSPEEVTVCKRESKFVLKSKVFLFVIVFIFLRLWRHSTPSNFLKFRKVDFSKSWTNSVKETNKRELFLLKLAYLKETLKLIISERIKWKVIVKTCSSNLKIFIEWKTRKFYWFSPGFSPLYNYRSNSRC